jgi:hypothetical protein
VPAYRRLGEWFTSGLGSVERFGAGCSGLSRFQLGVQIPDASPARQREQAGEEGREDPHRVPQAEAEGADEVMRDRARSRRSAGQRSELGRGLTWPAR